jgi:proprotein convertase subtilisin/kexin type 5
MMLGPDGRCGCSAGLAWDPEYYGCRACNLDCAPGGCSKSDYRVCTSCKEGFPKEVLINGQCICLAGYSRMSDSYKCEPCHYTCSTCSGRDYKSCLTCRDPFTTPINGICQCTDGTYFDNTYMSCTQCTSPCKTCLGRPYYCTSCNNGYTLYGNTCVCTNLAVCATNCHSSCRTCSGPNSNQCLSCKSSAVYLNNMCNCPYKSYMSSTGDCLPCADLNCVMCSPTGCAMCENGLTASNGVCVCPNPATEVLVNGYCTPKYTTQCTNPACLSCAADLTTCILLKSGNDLTAPAYPCGANLYRDSTGQCRACHEDCMECNGPYRNNCTYCKAGYPLENGVCRGLIANTYYVLRNPVACHPTCASCEGAGPNLCRSCYGDSDLVNSACICKYGGWRDSSQKCTWNCHYTCQTCNGPNYNNCLTCKLPILDQIGNICFCQTLAILWISKVVLVFLALHIVKLAAELKCMRALFAVQDLYLMLQESVFVDLGR